MLLQQLKPFMTGKTLLVWDWNGTLLDDVALCVSVMNSILADLRKPAISVDQYRDIFRFPVQNYYRDLGFNDETFKVHGAKFIERYYQRVPESRLFPHALSTLQATASLGFKSVILSASEEETLREIAGRLDVTRHVGEICGLDNHHAASKLDRARQMLVGKGLPPAQVLVIGDTDHDAETARTLGADCVLIEGGHQSKARLCKAGVPVIARL